MLRTAFNFVLAVGLVSVLVAQESRSVWDGVYTSDQAKHGKELYTKQCAGCHGESLTGGESAPPLAGGEFLSNWNGLSVGELFERIRTTMPLNNPRSLSREMNADILAFMFSVNEFPAGKTAMPNDAETLKHIQIDMVKPEKK
ncbi:MAG TPA: cytochrome c [Bryobacteraceae bacterium]|nr:cytochrome c [Bryobacteraceae bacterium]